MGVPSGEPNLSCSDPPLHCLSNLWVDVGGSRASFRAITGRWAGVPWRGDWSEVSPCRSCQLAAHPRFPDTHTSRLPSSLSLSLSLLSLLSASVPDSLLPRWPPCRRLRRSCTRNLTTLLQHCPFILYHFHPLQLLFLPRITFLPPSSPRPFSLNSPSNCLGPSRPPHCRHSGPLTNSGIHPSIAASFIPKPPLLSPARRRPRFCFQPSQSLPLKRCAQYIYPPIPL